MELLNWKDQRGWGKSVICKEGPPLKCTNEYETPKMEFTNCGCALAKMTFLTLGEVIENSLEMESVFVRCSEASEISMHVELVKSMSH